MVIFASPLAQASLVGTAGSLLQGLGSVLGESSVSAGGVVAGALSNVPIHAPLTATYMTGEGNSGRSERGGETGESSSRDAALVLLLQERQQKVLVMQVCWCA